jgi:predicted amidophosphoribosyltransferase
VTDPAPPLAATSNDGAVEVPGVFHYLGKPDATVAVRLLRRTPRQRGWRAATGLAKCWGLAVVAVFVPLLHFILVPALVLAGPLVARSRWLERASVLRARGACPGCGAALDLPLRQPAREEVTFRCSACGRPLALRLAPELIENAEPAPERTATHAG